MQIKAMGLELFQTVLDATYPSALDPALRARVTEGTGFPPQVSLGHVAIPCHPLSKALRVAPQAIAQALADKANQALPPHVQKVEALQGYFNIFLNTGEIARQAYADVRADRILKHTRTDGPREKIVFEYSQPNTHKILHVGHLRNAIYGDAAASLLQYIGHDVIRATYPGDMGAHIAKCLWYVSTHKKGQIPAQHRADWLGRMYAEADQFLAQNEGKPEGDAAKQSIGETLQQLEHMQGPIVPFYRETREWSLEHMRAIYAWLGIEFDRWYYESECDGPSRKLVEKKYQEGVFQLSQGAIGMDLSAFDLGFAMVLRSDGTGLYLTKDLELIQQKFSDPTVTQSIYVVDARQQHHFRQLFKVAEILGYPQAARSIHLSYDSVVDASGKAFSSRALDCTTLDELREMIRARVIKDYLQEKAADLGGDLETLADQIVVGALKYGFLKIDPQRIIRFLLDDWIKVEGDTGPYIQYTYARARNILRKAGRVPESMVPAFESDVEESLLYYALRLNTVATRAGEEYRPNALCEYLFELAKLFNRFYKECPVTKASTPAIQESRLALVELVSKHLAAGMGLLKIPTPERL